MDFKLAYQMRNYCIHNRGEGWEGGGGEKENMVKLRGKWKLGYSNHGQLMEIFPIYT